MPRATFTKAAVTRAIEAVRGAGMPVGAVEICRDGTIRVLTQAQVDEAPKPDNDEGPGKW